MNRRFNNYGSIAPLITYFAVIGICGVLHGIFSVIIEAVSSTGSSMNTLMWQAWIFTVVVILIVASGWLLMKAQKPKWAR